MQARHLDLELLMGAIAEVGRRCDVPAFVFGYREEETPLPERFVKACEEAVQPYINLIEEETSFKWGVPNAISKLKFQLIHEMMKSSKDSDYCVALLKAAAPWLRSLQDWACMPHYHTHDARLHCQE